MRIYKVVQETNTINYKEEENFFYSRSSSVIKHYEATFETYFLDKDVAEKILQEKIEEIKTGDAVIKNGSIYYVTKIWDGNNPPYKIIKHATIQEIFVIE